MKLCPTGHATHPQWRMAASLALAQLRGYMALPGYADMPNLGLLYITDHYASEAQAILDFFSAELPTVTDWSGTVGVGVCASGAEYFDEPALALMLLELPVDQYRVFSGVAPLPRTGSSSGFTAHTALVHADGHTPDLPGLIAEMAERTSSGSVFGGLAASRGPRVQFAVSGAGTVAGQGAASGVFHGGLSGVAWGAGLGLITQVTQGCQPVGPRHHITAAQDNVVLALDGEPALDVLLRTLGVSLQADPHQAVERVRGLLAGLTDPPKSYPLPTVQHPGHLGADVRVRHIVGLDGIRRGIALADQVQPGMGLQFCQRHAAAARADLVRICTEVREELAPDLAPLPQRHITGAIYVSCSGRGGNHFGAPGAELQLLRHALGDVPLVGFFAGGEIAGQHLYGYTAVLTVFTAPEAPDVSD